jgi:adenylate cyclase
MPWLASAAPRLTGLVLLVGLLLAHGFSARPLEFLQLRAFDLYQRLQPAPAGVGNSVVVDIDEASLAELGQWPWPRGLLAELVERSLAAGAAAVGFDAVFPEPDRASPKSMAGVVARDDPALAERLLALPDSDERFAASLAAGPVVLGQSVSLTARGASLPSRKPSIAQLGGSPLPFLFEQGRLVRNLPALEAAAAGVGIFAVFPEEDGIVRRIPAALRVEGTVQPALALEMLRVASGEPTILARVDDGIEGFQIADVMIPTDFNGRLWVRFPHHDPARFVSAKDVLAGAAGARLAGKLVLVGTSAVGLLDTKTTPLDRVVPGVEIHAMLLDAIVDGRTLTRPRLTLYAELSLTALFGLTLLALGPRLNALPLAAVGVGGVAIAFAVSWTAFASMQILVDATLAALAATTLAILFGYTNYRRTERQRRLMRATFSRYVAPALVERIAENPEAVRLGGERREVTILFSDLRGFTTISEGLDAEPLIALMNRYFTPMAGAILETGGMIDKYIGDAIMALWNAPLGDEAHARHACLAALEMRRRLVALNAELGAEASARGETFTPLLAGIGLGTGICAVGNIGAAQRLEYSALGDAVNLASRLEGQSRLYGVDNLVAEETRLLSPGIAALELDLLRVKGKLRPIRIFTLLGDETVAADPGFLQLETAHRELLALSRGQRWDEAEEVARYCRRLADPFGANRLYKKFRQRIELDRGRELPADWDGVHVAETK